MKTNMFDAIANLVWQSSSEVRIRSLKQREALRENKCSQPEMGRWVDRHDVNHLLSMLELDDLEFSSRFPMSHASSQDRRRLAAALARHFEQCIHCSLKRGYDVELDGRIEQACKEHAEELLILLNDEEVEVADESDHQYLDLALQPI